MNPPTFSINEVFLSIQGEGMRAGTANVFVRFTGCNLRCDMQPGPKSPGGFACDTEFESGRKMTIKELDQWIDKAAGQDWSETGEWLILTGGEPALQVTNQLIDELHALDYKLAIETNGSLRLAEPLDWITISPKVAEHAIKQCAADEVKYVRGYGQAIPRTRVNAEHKLISPAFNGLDPDPEALQWCIQLVKENPEWKLSPQLHKLWQVR